MGIIDLTKVPVHKVKTGVQGKMICIYGLPKTGKTTVACSFSKPLLFALEPGYNLLDGVQAVNVSSWLEIKNYAKQLRKPEVRELYDTIVIDTVSILWDYCERFITTQREIDDLSDQGFGKAYKAARKEFEETIHSLGQMGYAIVFLSHADKAETKIDSERTKVAYSLDMSTRPAKIIQRLVDVLVFVKQEKTGANTNKPVAYLRGGFYDDEEIDAGSRYKEGLPSKIDFSYEELDKAIKAADEAMLASGVKASEKNKTVLEEIGERESKSKKKERTFTEVYKETNDIIESLKIRMAEGEEDLRDNLVKIVETYLGPGKKLLEATPSQKDLVEAALAEIKEL